MDSLLKLLVLLLGCLLHACSRGEEGGEACLDGTYVCQEERKVCEEEEGDCSINAGLLNYGRWNDYFEAINASLGDHTPCAKEEEGCACFTSVAEDDLEVWQERGRVQWEEFAAAKDTTYGVHYQIINHTLFRQEKCPFPSRCVGVEHFLLQLLPTLPDVDLLINVRDYSISSRKLRPLPVFSFSKTPSYYDIMYPAWSFWAGGPAIATEPTGIGRWDLKRESLVAASEEWPWERKRDVGFFRGSRTSPERDPLVLLSREAPDLVDAQYTKNQAWRSEKDTLGLPPASVVTMEHHCQYKYLFNFRGVAASFRLRHLFLCRSLVLHVGQEWNEFFYPSLRPWVHYVPLPEDLSNVREVLEFLRENDGTAKEIAERGFHHIWTQLTMDAVACYWKELLTRYSELCRWTPQKQESYLQL